MSDQLKEQFKKFYDMKPYLLIEEDEWKDIMQTYEKEDVVEELANGTMFLLKKSGFHETNENPTTI